MRRYKLNPDGPEPTSIDVGCTWCRAEPGEPCDVRNGPKDRVFHLRRQDSANRARNRWLEATWERRHERD